MLQKKIRYTFCIYYTLSLGLIASEIIKWNGTKTPELLGIYCAYISLLFYLWENIGCSFCRLIRRPEHLIARHWYLPANWEGHSCGDQLISESVSVTPSSVIGASIVLCSVSLRLVWINVQLACAQNILYLDTTAIWLWLRFRASSVAIDCIE
jgi:hypothetical protein